MPTNYNRANLITESATLFPDNNSQLISPADLRQWLEDGTTSFVTQKDKSTLENTIYEAKATTISSLGGVVNLALASGNYLHISGTGTINSFGTCPAGARFILMFEEAATLQYNGTSLIIPGGTNKTVVAGDCCMIVSEGLGNWRIVGYFVGAGIGSGTITGVTAGTGLSGGGTSGSVTLNLANTTVSAGPYTNADITVDAQGRITSASSGTAGGVTSVSGTAPISSSGGSTPAISIPKATASVDGYLDSADWTTFNSKGSGTVTLVSGTAPIVSSGGTTPAISLPKATASVDGYLSNTDFSTFAGKQDALTSGTNIKTVNSTSLLGSGNVAVGTVTSITAGTGLNGGAITGSGTIDLANTTVTPASYTNADITVDAQGRITAAANGTGGGGSPGGANGEFQYKSGGSFAGAAELKYATGFVVAHTPKIGDSNTTGHFHMHNASTAPTGITNYLTMFWQSATRALGFRSETDANETYIQLTAPTADRTITLPDASGNVVLDTLTQTLTNKTLTSPSITTPAITTPAVTGIATFGNGTSAGEIRLLEASGDGSNYVALKAQAMGSDYSLTLPTTAGASGQVLQTNGSGGLSWVANGGNQSGQYLKNTTATTITNPAGNVIIQTLLIPGGTFTGNNSFILTYKNSSSVSTSSYNIGIAINTSAAFGGVTLIYQGVGAGTTAQHLLVGVNLWGGGSGDTTRYLYNPFTSGNSVGTSTTAINWAIDQYIVTSTSVSAARTITNLLIGLTPT